MLRSQLMSHGCCILQESHLLLCRCTAFFCPHLTPLWLGFRNLTCRIIVLDCSGVVTQGPGSIRVQTMANSPCPDPMCAGRQHDNTLLAITGSSCSQNLGMGRTDGWGSKSCISDTRSNSPFAPHRGGTGMGCRLSGHNSVLPPSPLSCWDLQGAPA